MRFVLQQHSNASDYLNNGTYGFCWTNDGRVYETNSFECASGFICFIGSCLYIYAIYGKKVAEIVVNLTDKHIRKESSFNMVYRLRPVIKRTCEKQKNELL